jgi:hypothetical protein
VSSATKIRDSVLELNDKLQDIVSRIDQLHVELYYKGSLSKSEFDSKLVTGEIADNECYSVDGSTYVGSICIDPNDTPCRLESDSAYQTRQLRSYTCSHCGGSIDANTMHCLYCGVKYFFI